MPDYEQRALDYDALARQLMQGAQGSGNTGAAYNWANSMLGGDMSLNPFMNRLNTSTQKWNGMVDDSYMNVMKYLTGAMGMGENSGPQLRTMGGGGGYGGGGGGGSNWSAMTVPDTVGNLDTFFARNARAIMDPSRLDPANDPTLKPAFEQMRRENTENLMASLQDVAARGEASGRMGSGTWQAQNTRAREESMESLDQAQAGMMMDSRKAAQALQQAIMGMTNDRDLGALRESVNMAGINAQSGAAAAGAAAQADAMKLQAAAQLMDAAKFGLGFQGDMASMLQQGQLGGLQGIIGLGGLDLDKINSAANIGNSLGLGSLGFGFGVQQARAAAEEAARNRAWEQAYNERQESRQNFFDIIGLINSMGGMGSQSFTQGNGSYIPSGMDPNLAGILGAFGGGIGGYDAGRRYFE